MVPRSKSEHESRIRKLKPTAFTANAGKAQGGGAQGGNLPISKDANMTTELKDQKLQVMESILNFKDGVKSKWQKKS